MRLPIAVASVVVTLCAPPLARATSGLGDHGPAVATAAPSQEPPSTFPAAVEEVLVDVVVSDVGGRPVGGLRRDDFVVAEDGVPQAILSFEAVEVAPGGPVRDPLEGRPTVSANPAAGGRPPGRTFLVLFDDVRLGPAQGLAARRALASFVRSGVDDADNLLLVTTSGSTWWGVRLADGRDDLLALVDGLQGRFAREVIPDQMSDAEAFRIVVQRDAETFEHVLRRFKRMDPGEFAPPRAATGFLDGTECDPRRLPSGAVDMDPGIVCEAARTTHLRAVARLRDTLGLLERGLAALGGVRGRKSAILVSPGFYYDLEQPEFRRVAEASRRSNTPVHFLNTSGLAEMPLEMSAAFGQPMAPGDVSLALLDQREAAGGAEVVAHDTGGFVVQNTNDLATGLRRIGDEARRYYLLGFAPANPARDGKYRKIDVRLAPGAAERTGGEVRARRGYYASKDGERQADPDAPVREALASPFDLAGVPVRATAHVLEEKTPGRARCLLVGEVDVRPLAFREEEGRLLASLDVAFTTTARDGSVTEHAQRVDMRLLPATRERLLREWYVVAHEVELPAGVHLVRVVVREVATGRVGSVSHRVDVPAPDSFRLSTPVVSDALEPGSPGGAPRPKPIARRWFAAGRRVFLSVDVFGAERGAATGTPRVSMGYEVVRADGEVVSRLEPKTIDPTPEGGLRRLVGFTIDAPGEYRLEGEVTDEQTGKALLFTEPFTVTPADAGPAGAR
jgi:VWFA-related protein